jgi:hypothetical protein
MVIFTSIKKKTWHVSFFQYGYTIFRTKSYIHTHGILVTFIHVVRNWSTVYLPVVGFGQTGSHIFKAHGSLKT